jgi:hypothetical protein
MNDTKEWNDLFEASFPNLHNTPQVDDHRPRVVVHEHTHDCPKCSEEIWDCECPNPHDSFQPSLDAVVDTSPQPCAAVCDPRGNRRFTFMTLCEAQIMVMDMPKGWSILNLSTGFSETNELAPRLKRIK